MLGVADVPNPASMKGRSIDRPNLNISLLVILLINLLQ